MSKLIKRGFKLLLWIISIWMMGFFLSNGYLNRVFQIMTLPFFIFSAYLFLLGFHELTHFFTALFLKVKVKGACSRGFHLYKEQNRWKLKLKDPFIGHSFEGCIFLKCDALTKKSELQFRKKLILIGISAPIFSLLAAWLIIYFSEFKFTDILALRCGMLIAIYLFVIATLGDVQTAIMCIKSRDFFLNLLLETDLLSNSYQESPSQDYLQEQIIYSIWKLKEQDVQKNEHQHKLLLYSKLLYLSLAEGVEKIDKNLFNYMVTQFRVLDYKKEKIKTNVSINQNQEILIYSILYAKLLLKDDICSKKILDFSIENNVLQNLNSELLRNMIKYMIEGNSGEGWYEILLKQCDKEIGSYQIFTRKIVERIGESYNQGD